jgi:hypothetical protein
MSDYLCLMIDQDNVVSEAHLLRFEKLDDAIFRAAALSRHKDGLRGFQLWSGGKLVATRFSRNGLSWNHAAPSAKRSA